MSSGTEETKHGLARLTETGWKETVSEETDSDRSAETGPTAIPHDHPRTPIEVLREELLEALIELWSAQTETVRLAQQWGRYEDDINAGAQAVVDIVSRSDTDTFAGIEAAIEALEENEALSGDQKAQSLRRGLRTAKPPTTKPARGRAVLVLRNVTSKRRDLGLLSSQLVTLVADFELFVLRVMTAWLEFDDSTLANKERTIKFPQLSTMDLSELRETMVQEYLDSHMRKSAKQWLKVFSEVFKCKGFPAAEDYATAEVFQRRNIIVHHAGLVSRTYLNELKDFEHDAHLGQHLAVDLEYVQLASDSLGAVAHEIVLEAMHSASKTAADREWVAREAAEMTFVLLQLDRNAVLETYSDATELHRIKDDFPREQTRVNGWIAKRRLDKIDSVRKRIESWDVRAKDPSFKLAKAALLGDVEGSVSLASRLVDADELSVSALASWPLFENIRAPLLQGVEKFLEEKIRAAAALEREKEAETEGDPSKQTATQPALEASAATASPDAADQPEALETSGASDEADESSGDSAGVTDPGASA